MTKLERWEEPKQEERLVYSDYHHVFRVFGSMMYARFEFERDAKDFLPSDVSKSKMCITGDEAIYYYIKGNSFGDRIDSHLVHSYDLHERDRIKDSFLEKLEERFQFTKELDKENEK